MTEPDRYVRRCVVCNHAEEPYYEGILYTDDYLSRACFVRYFSDNQWLIEEVEAESDKFTHQNCDGLYPGWLEAQ